MDMKFKTHLKKLLGYCSSLSDSHFREEEAGYGILLSNYKLGYWVTSGKANDLSCEVTICNTPFSSCNRLVPVIQLEVTKKIFFCSHLLCFLVIFSFSCPKEQMFCVC